MKDKKEFEEWLFFYKINQVISKLKKLKKDNKWFYYDDEKNCYIFDIKIHEELCRKDLEDKFHMEKLKGFRDDELKAYLVYKKELEKIDKNIN